MSPLYRLLQSKLGKDPIVDISERRAQGQSWRAIERAYDRTHDISVTAVTLRSWAAAAEARESQSA